jgi:endonuclease YncB( thermonuclease family)
MRPLYLLLIQIVLAGSALRVAGGDPIAPDRVEVVDGDTIELDGMKPDIRLVGFNAPEAGVAGEDLHAEQACGRRRIAR